MTCAVPGAQAALQGRVRSCWDEAHLHFLLSQPDLGTVTCPFPLCHSPCRGLACEDEGTSGAGGQRPSPQDVWREPPQKAQFLGWNLISVPSGMRERLAPPLAASVTTGARGCPPAVITNGVGWSAQCFRRRAGARGPGGPGRHSHCSLIPASALWPCGCSVELSRTPFAVLTVVPVTVWSWIQKHRVRPPSLTEAGLFVPTRCS